MNKDEEKRIFKKICERLQVLGKGNVIEHMIEISKNYYEDNEKDRDSQKRGE